MELYKLPESFRGQIKELWGQLLSDPINYDLINSRIRKASLVVVVGDASTETLASSGIIPDVFVVDSLENRLTRNLPELSFNFEFKVQNPPSHISDIAVTALLDSLKAKKPVRILIDGEEDLLSLPVIAFYPKDTLLFYGQPGRGLVMVNVNERRVDALNILKIMGLILPQAAICEM